MTDDESTDQIKPQQDAVDASRRKFLCAAAGVLGGTGALCALSPFISSMMPSEKTRESARPIQVNISQLKPGQQMTVVWRSLPIWIIRRTEAMQARLSAPNPMLRDPQSLASEQPPDATNIYRSIKPEYLVLIGVCTHLGCAPIYEPRENEQYSGWLGGFYCPCHGSSFDLSGRVMKHVPAPTNLKVPPYRFLDAETIEIGVL